MLAYHKQVIAVETSLKAKEAVLQSSTFLSIISEQLMSELEEFQESVRDEAQSLMLCMAQRFFPAEVAFNQDQVETVQMMRANIANGWELKNLKELKEAAQAEADMLSYLYKNAQKFVSKVLSVFMDETYGRDTYLTFFK